MVVLYRGFGKWEKTNSHGFKLKEMASKEFKKKKKTTTEAGWQCII